jgi:leucine dehydrogenase
MQAHDDGELWAGEQLILCRDDTVGLRAVIAIDDTTLGPALGGVRLRAFASDRDGVRECRRLAAAMTLKNAVAELPFGGAKAVILDGGPIADRQALMRRFGDFVRRTNGAYIPGVDMGTTVEDLALMAASGAEVSCSTADPSPATARGVWAAIRAAVVHLDGSADLTGVRVLVQGVGHVGAALAEQLARDGARVIVADVDRARAEAVAAAAGGTTVAPELAIETPCDVFAPCAVARVVNPETIDRLDCRIVAGAANDTLSDDGCADLLAARGIAYVPDFVANAGGVVHIHALRSGWDEKRLDAALLEIGQRVVELLAEAARDGVTPLAAAEARAGLRLGRSAPAATEAAV